MLQIKVVFPTASQNSIIYDMYASDDTGHHDAGYSYDTGHQTGFPSHRQLSKVALFILIYDKDLSSGCTLYAEKKLCIYLFPSLNAVLKICDPCREKMDIFAVAIFLSLL